MKCELEYEGYRYLRLRDPSQLDHHRSGAAFSKFLIGTADPSQLTFAVGGSPVEVDGGVLVWGAVTPEGRAAVKASEGFADVLSVESIVGDLNRWGNDDWQALIMRYDQYFEYLSSSLRNVGSNLPLGDID